MIRQLPGSVPFEGFVMNCVFMLYNVYVYVVNALAEVHDVLTVDLHVAPSLVVTGFHSKIQILHNGFECLFCDFMRLCLFVRASYTCVHTGSL